MVEYRNWMPAKTHGHSTNGSTSTTYNSWMNMRQRCSDPNCPKYPRYGGRGIRVCARWQRFENFLADMGEKPEGLTIGRKDNDGDYTPDNCRWEVAEQQANNKSNSRLFEKDGKTQTITQWSRELGVSVRALYYRIDTHGTIFID